MNNLHNKSSKKKGSILIIAMIFGVLMLASAGVLLNFGISEKTTNERHFLRLEAQAAAESAVEYGFAELQSRWNHKTNFQSNELTSNPLTLPASIGDFFAGSNVDLTEIEISGGDVSAGQWIYIDPKDPANILDPQKMKRVFTRDVEVYGKATVNATTGSRNKDAVSAYCAQFLQVRDAPIFSHAVFYNMDMEFYPGPRMDMHGPVHANGDLYIQANPAGGLYFHSTVMSAGDIFHKNKFLDRKWELQLGTVQIKDPDGNFKDMYTGSGDKLLYSSWYDSHMGDDWKSAAEDRWDGMVGTQSHEVPVMRPLSIQDFVPDDKSTPANELQNHAYALIEPQLPTSSPDYKGTAVQKEQFSYKAGLVMRVVESASDPSGYEYDFYKYQRTIPGEPNSERVLDGSGKPVEILLDKSLLPAGLVTITPYSEDGSGNPTGGFYEGRQETNMDVIEIDIGELNRVVDITSPGPLPGAWNGTYNWQNPTNLDWNGIMYVEIPYDGVASGRIDKIRPAKSGIAVRLTNGSRIPDSVHAPDPGFTFATNAPLYVLGDYNSDGDPGTGSATTTDNNQEPPAALVADTITVLSNNWDTGNYDSKSKLSKNDRPAVFTEFSAAFLTGQSASIPGTNAASGGVHNFPRFLERWSGKEFRYRGSLVSLWEGEVLWKQMIDGSAGYYSPPIRNFGFSEIFENGNFPPGTPMVRDFRRSHFRFISATEYAALTAP